jgi:CheY-like chemotaxis protein
VASRRSNPFRVLVVADEEGSALLTEEILTSAKRVRIVGCARNGREALTMAASLSPEVIVMDLQLPVMDGIKAIRRLREHGSTARMVVLMSEKDLMRIAEFRQAGADAFVLKPPPPEELVAAILGQSRQA